MKNEITSESIHSKIIHLPDRPPIMLAEDLAEIYQTKVKRVNESVRRNPDRFPEPEFCFRLTAAEIDMVRSQNATLKEKQHLIYAPWAFTRMGANQLSSVLRSSVAARRSVQIMRAFSALEVAAQSAAPDAMSEVRRAISEKIESARQNAASGIVRALARAARAGRDADFIYNLITYRKMGLTQGETGRLISASASTVRDYERDLKACGFSFKPVRPQSRGKTCLQEVR